MSGCEFVKFWIFLMTKHIQYCHWSKQLVQTFNFVISDVPYRANRPCTTWDNRRYNSYHNAIRWYWFNSWYPQTAILVWIKAETWKHTKPRDTCYLIKWQEIHFDFHFFGLLKNVLGLHPIWDAMSSSFNLMCFHRN